jgi:hypothetical protein
LVTVDCLPSKIKCRSLASFKLHISKLDLINMFVKGHLLEVTPCIFSIVPIDVSSINNNIIIFIFLHVPDYQEVSGNVFCSKSNRTELKLKSRLIFV